MSLGTGSPRRVRCCEQTEADSVIRVERARISPLVLRCPRRIPLPWDSGPRRARRSEGAVPQFTRQVSGQGQVGGRLPPGTARTRYVGVITPTSAMTFNLESATPVLRCLAKYGAPRSLTKNLPHCATALRPHSWGYRTPLSSRLEWVCLLEGGSRSACPTSAHGIPARALRPQSKFPPGPLESSTPSEGAPPLFPSPSTWQGLAQGGPYGEPSSRAGPAPGPAWHLLHQGGGEDGGS